MLQVPPRWDSSSINNCTKYLKMMQVEYDSNFKEKQEHPMNIWWKSNNQFISSDCITKCSNNPYYIWNTLFYSRFFQIQKQ